MRDCENFKLENVQGCRLCQRLKGNGGVPRGLVFAAQKHKSEQGSCPEGTRWGDRYQDLGIEDV